MNTNGNGEAAVAELTYGQKAVGVNFNPAGDPAVAAVKENAAKLIDQMHEFRNAEGTPSEAKRHASIAITDLEGACMRAVKALTWKE